MTLRLATLAPGDRGVDCFAPISPALAALLAADGFAFAMRYLCNLTPAEARGIFAAGLRLGLVQTGGATDTWVPSASLGATRGASFALAAHRFGDALGGLPLHTELVTDVESPAPHTTAAQVEGFVNAWTDEAEKAGCEAVLYEGCGIVCSSEELYHALRLRRFWKSASLVPPVAHRGYQMIQTAVEVSLHGQHFDLDTAQADQMGDLPSLLAWFA